MNSEDDVLEIRVNVKRSTRDWLLNKMAKTKVGLLQRQDFADFAGQIMELIVRTQKEEAPPETPAGPVAES